MQGLANGSKLKEVWTNKTRDQNCTGFAKQSPNIITIKPSLAPNQTAEVRLNVENENGKNSILLFDLK